MLPNQGEMLNILAVVVGRTFGTADGSFCAYSHEMKVPHIDLIERSTEIAIWSFQLLQRSDGSSPTYPPKLKIGAPLSPSKQPCNGF